MICHVFTIFFYSHKYGQSADVFSFSMVCVELATQRLPWHDAHGCGPESSAEVVADVRAGRRPPMPDSPLSALTVRCWDANPKQRPDFAEIAQALAALELPAS